MIAKSDLVILVVSTTLLGAGIYRWQNNMARLSAAQVVATTPTVSPRPASQVTTGAATSRTQTSAGQHVTAAASATGTGTARQVIVDAGGNAGNGQRDSAASNSRLDDSAGNVVGNAAAVTARPVNDQVTEQTGARVAGTGLQGNELLYGTYIVQEGDYLGKIAQAYGTTVATLRSINGIEGSLIDVDQIILYPLPAN